MNKRYYHLSFCKICKNRKPSLKEGLICNLTEKIADFDKNCPNFLLDRPELEKIKKQFQIEIENNYPSNNLESFFSNKDFEKPNKIQNRKYPSVAKTHGLEFKKDKGYDKLILIMFGVIIIILLYGNYINNYSWSLKSANIIGVLIFFILSIYFFYKAYFHKYETLITIDEHGINQKDKTLFWNDIFDYGIIRGKGRNSMEKKIIIGTITNGVQKIDLSELNVSLDEFIEIIQLNKKNVLQQRV